MILLKLECWGFKMNNLYNSFSHNTTVEIFQNAIHKLHVMIEKWDELQNADDWVFINKIDRTIGVGNFKNECYKFRPNLGLCSNIYSDFYIYKFHKEWIMQHGDPELIDDLCWIAGDDEYYETNVNLFKNPKRLHFCIWLRHRMIDELTNARKQMEKR